MKTSYLLAAALPALMTLQAILGLAYPDAYSDVDWIRSAWYGNDWVTLVLAVPLLVASLVLSARGSTRGILLWLGMLAYAIYNYAYYLLGAALNVFFPLYVGLLILACATLIHLLTRLDPAAIAHEFRPQTPIRMIGGYLAFVAAGLSAAWLGLWAAYAFGGQPPPIEPEALKVVAALDLTMMAPALTFGGVQLWRREPWGYLVAGLAAIQGALYLGVLTVNSVIAVQKGLADAPGEVPVWGTLAVATALAAGVLLANVRKRPAT